jgi:uncharacterized protein YjbI with pentapeptide repeats
MRWVNLERANLEGVDFKGAHVNLKKLAQAKSLTGATLPDGARYDSALSR